jgi:hypothetical protein
VTEMTAYELGEGATGDARVVVPSEHGADWPLAIGFSLVVIAMYAAIGYTLFLVLT